MHDKNKKIKVSGLITFHFGLNEVKRKNPTKALIFSNLKFLISHLVNMNLFLALHFW